MGATVTLNERKTSTPFRVKPKDLGELRAGLSLDKICELVELDDVEKANNVGRTLQSDRFLRGR
jgi:hypothetical protein